MIPAAGTQNRLIFRALNPEDVFMYCEDLFEPIDVITFFRSGKLIPLKFRWNGRVYKVKQVNGSWKENQGYGRQYHFSVQADGSDCFELLFDSSDFSWQLARVCLEG
jgi:hypothetical protein